MIQALLFDLDNTLIPEDAGWNLAFEAACAPVAAEMGIDVVALREAVFGAAAEKWAQGSLSRFCHELGLGSPSSLSTFCPGDDFRYAQIRDWLPSYRFQAWDVGLRALGVQDADLVDRLSTRFMHERSSHHHPYEGVEALLRNLRRDYRLAVLTNGFGDLQRQKLSFSGLGELFEVTLISGEMGFGKPDRRIFDLAFSRLGIEADEALVIGDSLDRDIAGAQAAGIRSIWLDAGQEETPDGVVAIVSLQELPSVLTQLQK